MPLVILSDAAAQLPYSSIKTEFQRHSSRSQLFFNSLLCEMWPICRQTITLDVCVADVARRFWVEWPSLRHNLSGKSATLLRLGWIE